MNLSMWDGKRGGRSCAMHLCQPCCGRETRQSLARCPPGTWHPPSCAYRQGPGAVRGAAGQGAFDGSLSGQRRRAHGVRKIKHLTQRAAFLRRSDGGGDNQPRSPGLRVWRGNIGKADDMAGQAASQPAAVIAAGIVADIGKRAAGLDKGIQGQTVGRGHGMPGPRRHHAGEKRKEQGKPGQKGTKPTDHVVWMHPGSENGNGILGTRCRPSGEILWDQGHAGLQLQTRAICRVGPVLKRAQMPTE